MSTVQSNILDKIQDALPATVFADPASPEPKLKPQHRKWIIGHVKRILEAQGYDHTEDWLSLVLTGSLTTYQYSDGSDCDVSFFVDAKHFPEWSRAEMIGIMVEHMDGKILPGTTYPMQCFVVPPGITRHDLYKPGLRSGYDLLTDSWIVPPDHDRVHDVQKEMNFMYVYALEQADKMERLLRYEPDKAKLFWHQIHEKRRQDQKAGKGDYAESNIVYKFLNNRGLFPQIAEATGEYLAKIAMDISGKAYQSTIKDGGVTINLKGEEPTTGYAFSPFIGAELVVPIGAFTPDAVANYVHTHYSELAQPDNFLGIWTQGQNIFIDVSQVVFDKDAALRRAAEAHQIAIWDIDNDQEINVPSTPDTRVAGLNHQDVLDANAGKDLDGLPGPVNVPGSGPLQFHGHAGIQQMAQDYNKQAGIQTEHPTDYTKVDPRFGAKVADEYERMQHNPHDPEVKTAYDALAKETKAQYDHIVDNGYNFSFYPEGHDPYPNSPREAVLDLHHNKHMHVYPTHDGYGNGDDNPSDHPLLGDSGVQWGSKPVTHNDLFRAVHDFYGHAKEGLGFRADGEDNAYRQHAAMFSPEARRALASETRGQNSWVNYGVNGQANQTAGQADTVFAPQKAGLMPSWTENPDIHRASRVAANPRQVAKFVYDPENNHLVLGQMANIEGEVESHNDLLQHSGIKPASAVFGQFNPLGRTEILSRPQLKGFSKAPMTKYESDYRLKQALEHAVPGVKVDSFTPGHQKWDNPDKPNITYTGTPPVVGDNHAPEQSEATEGQWEF
jgi:hypothetical protein